MDVIISNLINLIQQIDKIKSHFHIVPRIGFPSLNIIYDVPEFSNWKQELQFLLQGIYDRTKDKFVRDLLVLLKQGFNGWRDEESFNELAGGLLAISKNIDKYFSEKMISNNKTEEVQGLTQKSPKVCISHAAPDKGYVSKLVELLEDIGLNEQYIFCSSMPGYDIPLGEDIYDYLRQQFQKHDLHVIFILSDKYYDSVACMNEMGAAWVLKNKYMTILLPGFEFNKIEGAINPRQIGLKLDNDLTDVRNKLDQLKDSLITEFGLQDIHNTRWERKRNAFIDSVLSMKINNRLSDYAIALLQAACSDPNGTIIRTKSFDGVSIYVGDKNFVTSQEHREVIEWEAALEELLSVGYIKQQNVKGELFAVTKKGYDYIEQVRNKEG